MSIYDSRRYGDKLCESIKDRYEILRLPFHKTVSELTPEETKKYFQWFLAEIPSRLKILMRTVEAEDSTTYRLLDYTPDSITALSRWFPKHVHTLKMDPLEKQQQIEKLNLRLRPFVNRMVEDWNWTSETVSLCYDIGIYFAKIFQARYENVKWTYLTEPRDWVDVNKPVLEGFKVHMSPYDLVLVWAAKLRKGDEGAKNHLKRVFDFWTHEHILPGQKTGVYVRGKDKWTPD